LDFAHKLKSEKKIQKRTQRRRDAKVAQRKANALNADYADDTDRHGFFVFALSVSIRPIREIILPNNHSAFCLR
jgi:hypothetical protein